MSKPGKTILYYGGEEYPLGPIESVEAPDPKGDGPPTPKEATMAKLRSLIECGDIKITVREPCEVVPESVLIENVTITGKEVLEDGSTRVTLEWPEGQPDPWPKLGLIEPDEDDS